MRLFATDLGLASLASCWAVSCLVLGCTTSEPIDIGGGPPSGAAGTSPMGSVVGSNGGAAGTTGQAGNGSVAGTSGIAGSNGQNGGAGQAGTTGQGVFERDRPA